MRGDAATKRVRILAPAKVNLRLRVLRKRADGYHDIDSLMFAVSLYDELVVEAAPAPKTRLTCSVTGPERVEGGAGNLATRAASAVLDVLGVEARVRIRLRKNVPSGAGLGGGSSDAAAVLRVLPGLVGRRLPAAAAARIAAGLGADVPFFLTGRPARATGIGDRLAPVDGLPKGGFVVVVPADRVNTAWAYREALPHLTSGGSVRRVPAFPRCLDAHLDAMDAWFFNDFQPGVEKAFASVRRARQALEALGARATVLSGSGSAVVGAFADAAAAQDAAARLGKAGRAGSAGWKGKAFAVRLLGSAPRPEREA